MILSLMLLLLVTVQPFGFPVTAPAVKIFNQLANIVYARYNKTNKRKEEPTCPHSLF